MADLMNPVVKGVRIFGDYRQVFFTSGFKDDFRAATAYNIFYSFEDL
jgi:hypothetical protein